MRKSNNEKAKVIVVVIALCLVGIGALVGITLSLNKPAEAGPDIIVEKQDAEDEIELVNEDEPEPTPEAPAELEVKVDTSIDGAVEPLSKGLEQEIQEEPDRKETEAPAEPPAEVTEKEEEQPKEKPENTIIPEEKKEEPPKTETAPQNGEIKDGMIYIYGFGWVEYEGGGTVGIPATDMYENGNKVGNMD